MRLEMNSFYSKINVKYINQYLIAKDKPATPVI